jgi:hypothetical protein
MIILSLCDVLFLHKKHPFPRVNTNQVQGKANAHNSSRVCGAVRLGVVYDSQATNRSTAEGGGTHRKSSQFPLVPFGVIYFFIAIRIRVNNTLFAFGDLTNGDVKIREGVNKHPGSFRDET